MDKPRGALNRWGSPEMLELVDKINPRWAQMNATAQRSREDAAIVLEMNRAIDGTDQDPERIKTVLRGGYEAAMSRKEYPRALIYLRQLRQHDPHPRLGIAEGQVHMQLSQFVPSYTALSQTCRDYFSLDIQEAAEAVFLWLKAWYLNPQSDINENLLTIRYKPFLENIRSHFRPHFEPFYRKLCQIIDIMLTYRRRLENKDDEKGYDEAIRLAEGMGPQMDARFEVERERFIGAAHVELAEYRKGFLPQLHDPEEDRHKIVTQVEAAKRHTEKAIVAAGRLPTTYREGEVARLLYNLAKALVLGSRLEPGGKYFQTRAGTAVQQLRALSARIGNTHIVAISHTLEAELRRFGMHAPATPEDLESALLCNREALLADPTREGTVMAPLINIAEILIETNRISAAVPYVRKIQQLYDQSENWGFIAWAEESVQQLTHAAGLPFTRRKRSAT